MSTRKPLPGQQPGCHRGSATRSPYLRNPTSLPEEIARIATARRELLLRAHRFRLRREDLEDAYSQAVFELVMAARRGGRYIDRRHIGHALEQRFISRIHDRRRALSGRSPIQTALETARQLGSGHDEGTELVDVRAEVERLVILRAELRQVAKLASKLTPDQRLVLACQVGLQMGLAYGPAGHPDPRGVTEEDCSSSLNYLLYRSGYTLIQTIVRRNPVAQTYTRWGAPGPGRWVTIYATDRPTPHVFVTVASLRLDTSHDGTDIGPNRFQDGPRWRILDHIPTWAHWSVRHPPGL